MSAKSGSIHADGGRKRNARRRVVPSESARCLPNVPLEGFHLSHLLIVAGEGIAEVFDGGLPHEPVRRCRNRFAKAFVAASPRGTSWVSSRSSEGTEKRKRRTSYR